MVDGQLDFDNTGTNEKPGPRSLWPFLSLEKVGTEANRLDLPSNTMVNWYIYPFMY